MPAFTTQDLLKSIERKSFAPENQLTFDTEELLQMAHEELQVLILPRILSAREEYFVTSVDYPVIDGTAGYDIPARAIGLVVREVKLINSSGYFKDLPRYEPEDLRSDSKGSPEAFYLKGNQVHLYPTPSSSNETLRLYFYVTPGQFILPSNAATISQVNTASNIVTLNTIPSSWSTGDTFDFISKKGGHEYKAIDKDSTLVSGTDITFSSLPASLQVGDYVTRADESPLVQLPPNFRSVLSQATAARVLKAMNQPGGTDARDQAERLLQTAVEMITPRVRGEDSVLLPTNWF